MLSQISAIGAILISTLLFLTGHGLLNTLIPVRGHIEGFSTLALGYIGSAYNIGFVLGCLAGSRLLSRIGHIRTFAVSAGLATTMGLIQAMFVVPGLWFAVRIVYGFAAAAMFMVLESWLNDRADNRNRGQIFSAYMTVNFGGILTGQVMFAAAPPQDFMLFSVAAIFFAFCLIPVGMTALPQPRRPPVPKLHPRQMFAISPVGVAGCIAVGLANGAVWALMPLYAIDRGLSGGAIALFMVAFTLGGVLVQVPVGRLSDRMDRRYVIAAICALAAAGGIAMARLHFENPLILLGTIAIFGTLMLPLYGLSIAHANDRIPRKNFVEASATLLLINAAASVAGPTLAASAMDVVGASGLFFFTATIHTAMLVFVLVRLRLSDAPGPDFRENYKPVPVTTHATPRALELDPRGKKDSG